MNNPKEIIAIENLLKALSLDKNSAIAFFTSCFAFPLGKLEHLTQEEINKMLADEFKLIAMIDLSMIYKEIKTLNIVGFDNESLNF